MEIEKEVEAVDITAADTDTTIYSRTAGRRFELREFMISNNSGATARVRIWDGPSADGRKKLDVNIAAGETTEFDNKYRKFEYGDIIAQADSFPVCISGHGTEI